MLLEQNASYKCIKRVVADDIVSDHKARRRGGDKAGIETASS